MDIKCLVGLTLDACRFSKGSYTFEFSGKVSGEYRQFEVSTSCYLSLSFIEKEDVCEYFSLHLWGFLEQKLINVEESSDNFEVEFKFENEERFIIWGEAHSADNLLIVKEVKSGNWFPVL